MKAQPLRRQVLLSTTVLVGVLTAYGRSAYAACASTLPDPPNVFVCTGTETTQQTITVDNAQVTTQPGFSVNVGSPVNADAVHIEAGGALSFTDEFQSTVLIAPSVGLFVVSTGDVGSTPGSVTINTDGRLVGGLIGISARNNGSGGIDIKAYGEVSGTGSSSVGIDARNGADSEESLTVTTGVDAEVSGAGIGIYARNDGQGAIEVKAYGDVTGTGPSSTGIEARNGTSSTPAGTDLTVTTGAGTTVTGFSAGIRAVNRGSGALDITANGDIGRLGATPLIPTTGISALNSSDSQKGLTVTTRAGTTVTGANHGIYASNYGHGALEVKADGDVTGTNVYGIFARNALESEEGLTVTTGVGTTITGGDFGIRALNYGNGALAITANGDVTGTSQSGPFISSSGIEAKNGTFANPTGTDLTVTTEAGTTVKGRVNGIHATNYGSGMLSVTANGDVTGTGTASIGIYVNAINGTALDVTTGAGTTVTGGINGIDAINFGSGPLTVTANGNATGRSMHGIQAQNGNSTNQAGSDLTVITAAGTTITGGITGVGNGIDALNYGNGALSVTANGDVTSLNGPGISALNGANANGLSVAIGATGYVSSYFNPSIVATNGGSGAMRIDVDGRVRGDLGDAIQATNGSSGNGLTITTGVGSDIDAALVAIDARNQGGGILSITTKGKVASSDGDAIFASGSAIAITVAATGLVQSETTDADDFAIKTEDGPTSLTVAGTVTGDGGGAVQFDQTAALDDRLTLHTTAAVNGNVLAGSGTDSFVLGGGSGAASFDVASIGATQQFQNFELFAKEDASHWELTGTNTEIDNFAVNGGLLSVNGALANAAFTVNGGVLGGTGTIGALTVAPGGVFAPGNSIGTMTVNGAFTLKSNAVFEVEVNAAGQSDRVVVTGTVNLTGATLRVLAEHGNYKPKTDYLIVDNDGTDAVVGTFSKVTTNFAFLTPQVNYQARDGNDVVLTLLRTVVPSNGGFVSFCSVATTPNQCNVAHALDLFPTDNPLFLAVLTQTADGARQAFNALSGEIHATLPGMLADDSRYVREAVLGRLMQASYTNTAGQLAALGAGGPQVASRNTRAMTLGSDGEAMMLGSDKSLAMPSADPGLAFWTRAYGAWGDFDGNRNAAFAERDLGGFVSGVDAQVSNTWRLGLAAGGAWSNVSVGARHSAAEVESFHLAAYTGGMAGPLALRAGGAYAWQDIETNRAVVFPGFFERQESSYDADTGQLFGEIAYPLASGNIAFEPFAGLAYVNVDTGRFREHGGVLSALAGSSSDQDIGYSTLGLRAATATHWGSTLVVPKVSAAWQHAFDDVTPGAALAFASTGIGFGITGVPLAEDSLLLEAGLDFALSPTATFGVSYSGQHASEVSDNAVKGRLTWLF